MDMNNKTFFTFPDRAILSQYHGVERSSCNGVGLVCRQGLMTRGVFVCCLHINLYAKDPLPVAPPCVRTGSSSERCEITLLSSRTAVRAKKRTGRRLPGYTRFPFGGIVAFGRGVDAR